MSRMLTLAEIQALYRPMEGPTGPMPSRTQVAIVGAGPVGLTMAAVLGDAGISVVVVEKNAATADQPRAIMIDDEYMRTLASVGLMEPLEEHLTPPCGIHFLSPLGFPLARVPGFVTPNGFGGRRAMAQPVFEKVLLQALTRFPSVTARFQEAVNDISQDADHVTLTVADAAGAEHRLTADFVLACDGAHSFVRKHLAIPFEGHSIDEPHLVVDFAEFPDQDGFMKFTCNPRRPVNSIPAPYGGRRIEFMLAPGDRPADIVSLKSIRNLVDEFTPYRGVDLKVIRAAVYGFSERVAGKLRVGRVFLLGDAAHIMPPFGGQGLNTGARDVANLAWKIIAVLRGTASPKVLDSYDSERRSIIESIVAFAGRVGRVTNLRSRPLALLRDAAFAVGNLFPAVRRYFDEGRYVPRPFYEKGIFIHRPGDEESMTGRMFPRPLLRVADGTSKSLDGLVGRGFAIVGIGVPAEALASAATTPLAGSLPAPVISIGLGATPDAPATGVVMTALAEPDKPTPVKGQAGKILILRPDRYVAATATPETFAATAAELNRMLT